MQIWFSNFLNNKYRVFHHLLFWLAVYSDELLSYLGITDPMVLEPWAVFSMALGAVLFIYLNLYVLIPFFLIKKKYGVYIAGTLMVIFMHSLFERQILSYCESCDGELSFLTYVLSSGLQNGILLGSAVGLKLFKLWIKTQQKIKALETAKLETELDYLKSQINPHFLFNSLNNIYVQSKIDGNLAADSILKLSDLLRYQLYDCAKETVRIKDEINYLRNFLDLDKIRKSNVLIEFNVKCNDQGLMIPPFLFIPFVENAVKHGISTAKESYIKVDLVVEGNKLNFSVKNSKTQKNFHADKPGGLGLRNVKRRLQLLFPDKYKLNIKDTDSEYSVDLTLQMTSDGKT